MDNRQGSAQRIAEALLLRYFEPEELATLSPQELELLARMQSDALADADVEEQARYAGRMRRALTRHGLPPLRATRGSRRHWRRPP